MFTDRLTRALVIGLAAGASIVSAACGDSPTAPSPPIVTTFLQLNSAPGDPIVGGIVERITLEQGVWRTEFYDTFTSRQTLHVSVRPATGLGWWWDLRLSSAEGQPLRVGSYEAARRWGFAPASQPGLDFSGSGRGCNTITGRFVIHELTLGPANTVDRLHASFEQHCEGYSAGLRGEISIAANPWR